EHPPAPNNLIPANSRRSKSRSIWFCSDSQHLTNAKPALPLRSNNIHTPRSSSQITRPSPR
ncbi:hypothetical protein FS749_011345, partial [Ceratobasidium sp. UAMH 11750]